MSSADATAEKKKQEAILRKIAQRSKAAQKAAATAGKKHHQRTDAIDAATREDAKLLRKKLAAIITPADIATLKELPPNRPVPPHRHDVHVKNGTITVWVTLHKVPPQTVDISRTTDRKLVVDCVKNTTKPFLLEFPFPHGIRVDAAKATYEFDSGMLKCVLPVPEMPQAAQDEWNNRLASIRSSQRARFTTTTEGALQVRVKPVVLKRAREEGAGAKSSGATKEASPAAEQAVDSASKKISAAAAPPSKKNVSTPAASSAPTMKNQRRAEPQESDDDSDDAEAGRRQPAPRKEAPAGAAKPKNQAKHVDPLGGKLTSDAQARAIAKAAGESASLTLKEKLAKAREMHKARVAKTSVRDQRRDDRKADEHDTLRRVVAEQQERLMKKAERLEPMETPSKKPAPKSATTPASEKRKSVRFS